MDAVDTISSIRDLRFVWLEITGSCQLACVHCYAESGPTGTHGTMTGGDWRRVIDQAAALGVRLVQFIGGEPTMHPELPRLVDHALRKLGGIDLLLRKGAGCLPVQVEQGLDPELQRKAARTELHLQWIHRRQEHGRRAGAFADRPAHLSRSARVAG